MSSTTISSTLTPYYPDYKWSFNPDKSFENLNVDAELYQLPMEAGEVSTSSINSKTMFPRTVSFKEKISTIYQIVLKAKEKGGDYIVIPWKMTTLKLNLVASILFALYGLRVTHVIQKKSDGVDLNTTTDVDGEIDLPSPDFDALRISWSQDSLCSDSLINTFQTCLQKHKFTDFTITCSEKGSPKIFEYPVHRMLLMKKSPYFDEFFQGHVDRQTAFSCSPKVTQALIDYIYEKIFIPPDNFSIEELFELYKEANLLRLDTLKTGCIQRLRSLSIKDIATCEKLLEYSEKFSNLKEDEAKAFSQRLKERCENFLISSINEENFNKLQNLSVTFKLTKLYMHLISFIEEILKPYENDNFIYTDNTLKAACVQKLKAFPIYNRETYEKLLEFSNKISNLMEENELKSFQNILTETANRFKFL